MKLEDFICWSVILALKTKFGKVLPRSTIPAQVTIDDTGYGRDIAYSDYAVNSLASSGIQPTLSLEILISQRS